MGRTNIDIDDDLVHRVMVRYDLKTKREAVDYALRHLAGQPLTTDEALALGGSMPDFATPADDTTFDDVSHTSEAATITQVSRDDSSAG